MATGLFDPQHPEVVSLRRRIQATGGLNRSREILANTESADEKYVSRSMGLPQSHLMDLSEQTLPKVAFILKSRWGFQLQTSPDFLLPTGS